MASGGGGGRCKERSPKARYRYSSMGGDTGKTGGATPGDACPGSGPCRQPVADNAGSVDGRESLHPQSSPPIPPRYTITRPPNLPHRSYRTATSCRTAAWHRTAAIAPQLLHRSAAHGDRHPGDRPASSRREASRGEWAFKRMANEIPPRLGVFAISHAGAKAMPPRA